MKLVDSELLAKDLETGLGEVYWLLGGFNPEYRLSMGVCGMVTVALSEHLTQAGVEHSLVETVPDIDTEWDENHNFIVVQDETILDATYTSLYKYVGLTAGYMAMSGRGRLFPKDKIAVLPVGDHEKLAQQMGLQARYFMNHYVPIDELPHRRIAFEGKTEEEIAEALALVWNPENFAAYEPSEPTIEIGKRLAKFILPEHVKLVA